MTRIGLTLLLQEIKAYIGLHILIDTNQLQLLVAKNMHAKQQYVLNFSCDLFTNIIKQDNIIRKESLDLFNINTIITCFYVIFNFITLYNI